jgi:hypothetical protein
VGSSVLQRENRVTRTTFRQYDHSKQLTGMILHPIHILQTKLLFRSCCLSCTVVQSVVANILAVHSYYMDHILLDTRVDIIGVEGYSYGISHRKQMHLYKPGITQETHAFIIQILLHRRYTMTYIFAADVFDDDDGRNNPAMTLLAAVMLTPLRTSEQVRRPSSKIVMLTFRSGCS